MSAAPKTKREVATDLYISAHTVCSHVRIVFEKTGVANRTQAALYAINHGLADK